MTPTMAEAAAIMQPHNDLLTAQMRADEAELKWKMLRTLIAKWITEPDEDEHSWLNGFDRGVNVAIRSVLSSMDIIDGKEVIVDACDSKQTAHNAGPATGADHGASEGTNGL